MKRYKLSFQLFLVTYCISIIFLECARSAPAEMEFSPKNCKELVSKGKQFEIVEGENIDKKIGKIHLVVDVPGNDLVERVVKFAVTDLKQVFNFDAGKEDGNNSVADTLIWLGEGIYKGKAGVGGYNVEARYEEIQKGITPEIVGKNPRDSVNSVLFHLTYMKREQKAQEAFYVITKFSSKGEFLKLTATQDQKRQATYQVNQICNKGFGYEVDGKMVEDKGINLDFLTVKVQAKAPITVPEAKKTQEE